MGSPRQYGARLAYRFLKYFSEIGATPRRAASFFDAVFASFLAAADGNLLMCGIRAFGGLRSRSRAKRALQSLAIDCIYLRMNSSVQLRAFTGCLDGGTTSQWRQSLSLLPAADGFLVPEPRVLAVSVLEVSR
jgi:hypothetical protein